MDRRLGIATSFLILALVALAAGQLSSAGAPAAGGASSLPQPAPRPMTERPQALSVLPGGAAVALQLPAGMSGDFAHTHYASTDRRTAPSIYIPSDSWRFTARRLHRAIHAHRIGAPVC